MSIVSDAVRILDWMVELRRAIHRHPELKYEETQTSRLVCETLAAIGIPFQFPIAKTGVVGIIGTGQSPCIALRADMDALPITEDSGVSFQSEVVGRMHACGHDCHTAMLLGAARLLKERERELRGTIKLIFQPAEEGGAGAEVMCQEGVLEHPRVERIFGLHVWPGIATGKVAGGAGAILAATGALEIVVTGKGGHAALPHLAIDPVVCAAKIIVELQTIVSRESNPFSPSVVSVCSISGGDGHNVIPGVVRMKASFRSLSNDGLNVLSQRIEEIATAVAAANRCSATVTSLGRNYPPTVNDAACWSLARDSAAELFGSNNILPIEPILGGEDFAFYQQRIPGCFAVVGVANPDWSVAYPLHHPKFRVDEDALPIGAAWHVANALRALGD